MFGVFGVVRGRGMKGNFAGLTGQVEFLFLIENQPGSLSDLVGIHLVEKCE
jgi:hypothetical protein